MIKPQLCKYINYGLKEALIEGAISLLKTPNITECLSCLTGYYLNLSTLQC
jgi:hypothetical protein